MKNILTVQFAYKDSFWPYESVAMVRDEGTGRLEVTSADGEVAFLIGEIDDYDHAPWTRIAPGILVHPAHVRRRRGTLSLPGGWTVPFEGKLAVRKLKEDKDLIPGTTLRRADVVRLRPLRRTGAGREVAWVTTHGEVPADVYLMQAVKLHGDLILLGHDDWVNRQHVRSLARDTRGTTITLSTGETRLLWAGPGLDQLRAGFGLLPPRQREMPAPFRALFSLELRDYPFDLFEASAETLQRLFGGRAYYLMANVLWQTVRQRGQGLSTTWGTSERAYWYRPMLPILVRAGHVKARVTMSLLGRKAGDMADKWDLYVQYLRVLANMVKRERLCTFHDLGFEDHRPELRGVGARHPEVVLICEKTSLQPHVQRLAEHFGVSWSVSHGFPKLQSAEHLAQDLRPVLRRPLRVIGYVDYDPWGWSIAQTFGRHMARFGVKTASIEYLVTPDRFTERELKLYSYALKAPHGQATAIKAWVARTGGIGGKARGMHSDHLVPYERVAEALAALLPASTR